MPLCACVCVNQVKCHFLINTKVGKTHMCADKRTKNMFIVNFFSLEIPMEMGQANRCGDEKMINKWARDKLVDRLRTETRMRKIERKNCKEAHTEGEASEQKNKVEMKSPYAVMKNASDANNIITPNYVDCLDFLQSKLTNTQAKSK